MAFINKLPTIKKNYTEKVASSTLIRGMASSAATELVIKHVTVIGGGSMGSGIAQVAATAGYNVTIVAINDQLIEKAHSSIKISLNRIAKKQFKDDRDLQGQFIADILKRLNGSTDLMGVVKQTDLVIEAVIENIKIKHEIFRSIDKVAPYHTIFASNTSSLSISKIAAVTNRKDRFGGLHFFNPVPLIRLLEIIRTTETSDATYRQMRGFGEQLGKSCITCKDTPGFVVNRLLMPYTSEAMRMLERGDASARDIDTAMKLGAGYPMGPIELADYVGLDTTYNVLMGWHEKDPNNPLFKPMPMLKHLVKAGKLGVKSGEGFYKYDKKNTTSNL